MREALETEQCVVDCPSPNSLVQVEINLDTAGQLMPMTKRVINCLSFSTAILGNQKPRQTYITDILSLPS